MKIKEQLLNHVSRIDTECDSMQKVIDESNASLFSSLFYGDQLDQMQKKVWKRRLMGGVLEILANLLPD